MSNPSIYVISAMCGNFLWESGCNPQRHESGTNFTDLTDVTQYGGYGIGQWTNKTYPDGRVLRRRTDLVNWLRANGYSDYDGNGELAFLLYENHWSQNVGSYATLTDFLNSTSTDINKLTRIFMRNWEGINHRLQTRQEYANQVYYYITDHAIDPNITTWVYNTGSIGWVDSLNNCVLVYRYMNGVIPPDPPDPPDPPTPSKHRKMPIWMYLRY